MEDLSVVDHYSEMDFDELMFALIDINNAIEEEYRRSKTAEHQERHLKIIKQYKEERAYVRKLIKELMPE